MRKLRVFCNDPDATDSSSSDEGCRIGEKPMKKKRFIREITFPGADEPPKEEEPLMPFSAEKKYQGVCRMMWGVEVKSGTSHKVLPRAGKILHLSQACLEDVKDRHNDYIRLYAKIKKTGQKFVIGMLSHERFPHLNLDLVFDGEFELSHDLKQGSVHFAGYEADDAGSSLDEDESGDDEELVPIENLSNGKPEDKKPKPSEAKANAGVKLETEQGKSKVKIVEPSKDAKKNAEDDDTEDDEDDDDESAEDEDMVSSDAGSDAEGDSDNEDDSDDEVDSDEETPTKPEPAKKRPGESSKTPVPEKKAKFSTPQQKADGKKVSGHVATPHPAKQTGKKPANSDKSNTQTPTKAFNCPSCNKSFGSEQAVQSHSKAKHSGK